MKRDKLHRGRPSRAQRFALLAEALEELVVQAGGLPGPSSASGIWSSIWHLEVHHSTALEGNTLAIGEVRRLLEEGQATGDKRFADYLEVLGYADAAQWVYRHALDPAGWTTGSLVSIAELRHVHQLAMAKVWEVAPHPEAGEQEGPGSFRRHELAPFPDGMQPPSWVHVEAEVSAWVDSLASAANAERPIEALAAAHGAFERIHPFIDGNGRAGRLALNLALIRLGYPPAIFFTRDRERYLKALRRCDRGEPGALAELIARSVTDNIYRFILPAVTDDGQLLPLTALASPRLQIGAMRRAIERGRLRAIKADGGQWRSSRAWVEEYLASKHQR